MPALPTLRPIARLLWLAVPLALLATSALAQAPAVPAAAVPDTTQVVNPYGLQALWAQSDLVAKGVLAILAVMSMGSWAVIATKLFEQAAMRRQARQAGDTFWQSADLQAGTQALPDGSPFRFIAEAGLQAHQRHRMLQAGVDVADWLDAAIQRAAERVQRRLSGGMSFLATVGATSPFIGLFGTVWGIYHALTAIGVAGQASIDKVAGPVGEALIMTAIGLAVAVPAVLGYNWLLKRNTGVMDEVRDFSDDLHAALLTRPLAAA